MQAPFLPPLDNGWRWFVQMGVMLPPRRLDLQILRDHGKGEQTGFRLREVYKPGSLGDRKGA